MKDILELAAMRRDRYLREAAKLEEFIRFGQQIAQQEKARLVASAPQPGARSHRPTGEREG